MAGGATVFPGPPNWYATLSYMIKNICNEKHKQVEFLNLPFFSFHPSLTIENAIFNLLVQNLEYHKGIFVAFKHIFIQTQIKTANN